MERALGHPRGIGWVDDQNKIKTKQESTRLPHNFVGCMTNFNKTLINWLIVLSNLGAEVDQNGTFSKNGRDMKLLANDHF